eukprot:m.155112 g.155112  ORF g.155112 m.155112 type:complete len:206 (-) comp17929_c0_seq2:504-1121(-)
MPAKASRMALSRVKRELAETKRDTEIQDANITCTLVNPGDYFHLAGTIEGPPQTPYAGGNFKLSIEIPEAYPFSPPKVKFLTPIWHPNISSQTGAICLDILKDQWAAAMTLTKVLISIQVLLSSAEPDDPQDAVVATQYKDDRAMFERTAAHWTSAYADGPPLEGSKEQDLVCQLMGMGFDAKASRTALSNNNWNVEKALESMLG